MSEIVGLLKEASATINGQRQQYYGSPTVLFQRIADLWSAYLGIEINVVDVTYIMVLMKVSRGKRDAERFGGNEVGETDSIVKIGKDNPMDIAGYVGCLDLMGVVE